MGSSSVRRRTREGSPAALGAALAGILALAPGLALGQADAGAPHHAAAAGEHAAGNAPGSALKRIPNPNMLSEGVRARLSERAAARHPSQVAAEPREPAEQARAPGASGGWDGARSARSEPLRRGEAHLRRVQARDVGGVTVLSNRWREPPAARLAAALPPAPEPEAPAEPERATDESAPLRESRSVRALSPRRAEPRAASTSGGLLWPFVLFIATGAIVGTLWFRKKTQ